MQTLKVGSTQVHIRNSTFKSIELPLPPLSEQKRIAQVLGDVDALIQKLETLIAKKRDIKQAAMQDLLTGKRRLPGFSGPWETKKLGDYFIIVDGTHQTPSYVEDGIPFFSVETVTNKDFSNVKYISYSEHSYLTRKYRIEKGDILMTRIGSIGDCVLIDWEVNASFYVSLALLKPKSSTIARFLVHASRTRFFQKSIELNSLQHAIPKKINLGKISDVEFFIPVEITEQTAIAQVLSDMDNELTQLETRLGKTRDLKAGLMQQLLTGKIRLV